MHNKGGAAVPTLRIILEFLGPMTIGIILARCKEHVLLRLHKAFVVHWIKPIADVDPDVGVWKQQRGHGGNVHYSTCSRLAIY